MFACGSSKLEIIEMCDPIDWTGRDVRSLTPFLAQMRISRGDIWNVFSFLQAKHHFSRLTDKSDRITRGGKL